jgi:hypothetical protein
MAMSQPLFGTFVEIVGNRCGRGFLQNSHDFHASSFEGLLGGLAAASSRSGSSMIPMAAIMVLPPSFLESQILLGPRVKLELRKNCTFQVWKMP